MHGGSLEEGQEAIGVVAAVGQIEQAEERLDERAVRAQAAVGDRERDAPRPGRAAEHRLDGRRVGVDVGRHHDHVGR